MEHHTIIIFLKMNNKYKKFKRPLKTDRGMKIKYSHSWEYGSRSNRVSGFLATATQPLLEENGRCPQGPSTAELQISRPSQKVFFALRNPSSPFYRWLSKCFLTSILYSPLSVALARPVSTQVISPSSWRLTGKPRLYVSNSSTHYLRVGIGPIPSSTNSRKAIFSSSFYHSWESFHQNCFGGDTGLR